MDTEKRFGIKKPKAIMLFVQMIIIIFLLVVSTYLLIFVISNNLGPWMIISYIAITLSVLAIIYYSVVGYKQTDMIYQLSILPFIVAIFVNILLPMRETFQIAMLTVLFALTFAFTLRQKDKRFTSIISVLMIVISLAFSIYSALKANINFLGSLEDNWPTYIAMYSSIFVPVVMSVTIALTYNVRCNRKA